MTKIKLNSRNADKHILYEKAVQNVDFDIDFVKRVYKKIRGKEATLLKEDFCGTFNLCCNWVQKNSLHRAVGVDIHAPTLQWGKKNNLSKLSDEQQKNITLFCDNVLNVNRPQTEVVVAFNFSYFLFKTRTELLGYFKNAFKSLKSDGILFMDSFGGSESYLVLEEKRKISGFTYIWEHASYHPVTSETMCKIHFEFPDGSKMRNAFVYDWRLWTLAEINELLLEAGFREVQIYWEGTDSETGKGNGVFRITKKGEPCESWIAYVVAIK